MLHESATTKLTDFNQQDVSVQQESETGSFIFNLKRHITETEGD